MTTRSSKRRKTRYLSLRRRLAAAAFAVTPMVDIDHSSPSSTSDHAQLPLFPLHPDPTLHDHHGDHLSRFFPSDDAVSLHSFLGPPSTDNSASSAATALSEGPRSPSSSSANYSACSSSYGNQPADVGGLARAALRGRERWLAEEEGEAADLLAGASRQLSLKLDYQGILSAWSGKGPLFVEGEALQVVPDVHNSAPGLHYAAPVYVNVAGCGSGGGLWTVPDGRGGGRLADGDGEERCDGSRAAEEEEGEEKKTARKGDREARVMRYKEKRTHRLFSKRIRYEVRKLNAEKRPRLKGRFVKRDE